MAISRVVQPDQALPIAIRVPYYVPGRLLTPEDLQSDREAALERLALIGQAAGTGIVEGLWVEMLGSKTLSVSKGLGINRAGHPISLASGATINLPPTAPASNAQGDVVFGPCSPSLAVNTGSLKDGPYLLTAVPVYRLSDEGVSVKRLLPRVTKDGCESKWEEESVDFRIVYLGQPDLPDGFFMGTGVTAENRRNLLAHWAFGTAQLLPAIQDPFQGWSNLDYSGFGVSRVKFEANNDLTDCDLRLAVFYWEQNAIQFVDNWTVRRRLTRSSLLSATARNASGQGKLFPGWSQRVSDQLAAEGEARFAQFQEQLDALRLPPNQVTVIAANYFPYLPPAGYVPLALSNSLRQMIDLFVIDLFLEEVKKYSANPVGSELFWKTPAIQPLQAFQEDANVYDFQINSLIDQINTSFGTILSAVNALALAAQQQPITFVPIRPLRPYIDDDSSSEVYFDMHVIPTAWNDRVLGEINTWLEPLTNLINQLGTSYGISIPRPYIIPVLTISDGEEGHSHITFDQVNQVDINSLNIIISQFMNALSVMGSPSSFADNLLFKQIRVQLLSLLQNSPVPVFNFAPNGIQVDSFFMRSDLSSGIKTLSLVEQNVAAYTYNQSLSDTINIGSVSQLGSYIKTLGFTDRQTIEHMLEESWRDPTIDLRSDPPLSLFLVYEDVVPFVAQQLKNILDALQYANTDNLWTVWNAGVRSTFDKIISARSGNTPPPMYGLFTREVHPLQLTAWAQSTPRTGKLVDDTLRKQLGMNL